ARVISQGERVRLIVRGAADQRHARSVLTASGVDLKRIDFVTAATDRSWTRDFVPSMVVQRGRAAKKASHVAAVRFRFNGWSRYENHARDVAAGKIALDYLKLQRFE